MFLNKTVCFFLLFLLKLCYQESIDIFVSQLGSCINQNCDGSVNKPFKNITSAFQFLDSISKTKTTGEPRMATLFLDEKIPVYPIIDTEFPPEDNKITFFDGAVSDFTLQIRPSNLINPSNGVPNYVTISIRSEKIVFKLLNTISFLNIILEGKSLSVLKKQPQPSCFNSLEGCCNNFEQYIDPNDQCYLRMWEHSNINSGDKLHCLFESQENQIVTPSLIFMNTHILNMRSLMRYHSFACVISDINIKSEYTTFQNISFPKGFISILDEKKIQNSSITIEIKTGQILGLNSYQLTFNKAPYIECFFNLGLSMSMNTSIQFIHPVLASFSSDITLINIAYWDSFNLAYADASQIYFCFLNLENVQNIALKSSSFVNISTPDDQSYFIRIYNNAITTIESTAFKGGQLPSLFEIDISGLINFNNTQCTMLKSTSALVRMIDAMTITISLSQFTSMVINRGGIFELASKINSFTVTMSLFQRVSSLKEGTIISSLGIRSLGELALIGCQFIELMSSYDSLFLLYHSEQTNVRVEENAFIAAQIPKGIFSLFYSRTSNESRETNSIAIVKNKFIIITGFLEQESYINAVLIIGNYFSQFFLNQMVSIVEAGNISLISNQFFDFLTAKTLISAIRPKFFKLSQSYFNNISCGSFMDAYYGNYEITKSQFLKMISFFKCTIMYISPLTDLKEINLIHYQDCTFTEHTPYSGVMMGFQAPKTILLISCTFNHFYASRTGVVIFLVQYQEITVRNCLFTNMDISTGGIINANTYVTVYMFDTIIQRIKTTTAGALIYQLFGSRAFLSGVTFRGYLSLIQGSGIQSEGFTYTYCENIFVYDVKIRDSGGFISIRNTAELDIKNILFSQAKCVYACFLESYEFQRILIENVRIEDVSVSEKGAVFHVINSLNPFTVKKCFINRISAGEGGIIYSQDATLLEFINMTASNVESTRAGGFYLRSVETVKLKDVILFNVSASETACLRVENINIIIESSQFSQADSVNEGAIIKSQDSNITFLYASFSDIKKSPNLFLITSSVNCFFYINSSVLTNSSPSKSVIQGFRSEENGVSGIYLFNCTIDSNTFDRFLDSISVEILINKAFFKFNNLTALSTEVTFMFMVDSGSVILENMVLEGNKLMGFMKAIDNKRVRVNEFNFMLGNKILLNYFALFHVEKANLISILNTKLSLSQILKADSNLGLITLLFTSGSLGAQNLIRNTSFVGDDKHMQSLEACLIQIQGTAMKLENIQIENLVVTKNFLAVSDMQSYLNISKLLVINSTAQGILINLNTYYQLNIEHVDCRNTTLLEGFNIEQVALSSLVYEQVNIADIIILNSFLVFRFIYLSYLKVTSFTVTNSILNNQDPLILSKEIKTAIFENLNIQNTQNSGCLKIINAESSGSVEITESLFDSCRNYAPGGAVSAQGEVDLFIEGVSFLNNTSQLKGGAISVDLTSKIPYIRSSLFANNQANTKGGAISLHSPSLNNGKNSRKKLEEKYFSTLSNNNFKGNKVVSEINFEPNISTFSYSQNVSVYSEDTGFLKFNFFYSNDPILKQTPIEIFSGEKLNLVIEFYDHLEQRTSDLHQKLVTCSLNQTASHKGFTFLMEGNLKEINKNVLNLSAMSITSTYLGAGLSYYCSIINQGTESPFDNYTKLELLKLDLILIPCKKGQIFQQNRCKVCSKNFYSLVDKPDSTTICNPCPENAACYAGKHVIPKLGYWNLNTESEYIIQCRITEACPFPEWAKDALRLESNEKIGYSCGEGYGGQLCISCLEGHSKNVNDECIDCDSREFRLTLFIEIIRLIILLALINLQNLLFYQEGPRNSAYLALKHMIYFLNANTIIFDRNKNIASTMKGFKKFLTAFSFYGKKIFAIGGCSQSVPHRIIFNALDGWLSPLVFFVLGLIPIFIRLPFPFASLYAKKDKYEIIQRTKNLFLIVLSSFFPYLFYQLLNPMLCLKLDVLGDINIVSNFPEIECGDHVQYTAIFAITIPLAIVYSLLTLYLTPSYRNSLNKKKFDDPANTFSTFEIMKCSVHITLIFITMTEGYFSYSIRTAPVFLILLTVLTTAVGIKNSLNSFFNVFGLIFIFTNFLLFSINAESEDLTKIEISIFFSFFILVLTASIFSAKLNLKKAIKKPTE